MIVARAATSVINQCTDAVHRLAVLLSPRYRDRVLNALLRALRGFPHDAKAVVPASSAIADIARTRCLNPVALGVVPLLAHLLQQHKDDCKVVSAATAALSYATALAPGRTGVRQGSKALAAEDGVADLLVFVLHKYGESEACISVEVCNIMATVAQQESACAALGKAGAVAATSRLLRPQAARCARTGKTVPLAMTASGVLAWLSQLPSHIDYFERDAVLPAILGVLRSFARGGAGAAAHEAADGVGADAAEAAAMVLVNVARVSPGCRKPLRAFGAAEIAAAVVVRVGHESSCSHHVNARAHCVELVRVLSVGAEVREKP